MKASSYEKKVAQILRKAGIEFEREKTFTDLKKGSYRFDFYLPLQNICIEVNGQQHYEFLPHFHRTKQDFWAGQMRDRRKISYCLAHSISLYCIPYWDMEKISSPLDLFSDVYLTSSKYHNDNAWRAHQNHIKFSS